MLSKVLLLFFSMKQNLTHRWLLRKLSLIAVRNKGPAFAAQLNDALFPFVRQFANHDRDWFDAQPWANVHAWLAEHLESEEFKRCMKKEKPWVEGNETVLFP